MRTKRDFKRFVDDIVYLATINVRCDHIMKQSTPVDEFKTRLLANHYRKKNKGARYTLSLKAGGKNE